MKPFLPLLHHPLSIAGLATHTHTPPRPPKKLRGSPLCQCGWAALLYPEHAEGKWRCFLMEQVAWAAPFHTGTRVQRGSGEALFNGANTLLHWKMSPASYQVAEWLCEPREGQERMGPQQWICLRATDGLNPALIPTDPKFSGDGE